MGKIAKALLQKRITSKVDIAALKKEIASKLPESTSREALQKAVAQEYPKRARALRARRVQDLRTEALDDYRADIMEAINKRLEGVLFPENYEREAAALKTYRQMLYERSMPSWPYHWKYAKGTKAMVNTYPTRTASEAFNDLSEQYRGKGTHLYLRFKNALSSTGLEPNNKQFDVAFVGPRSELPGEMPLSMKRYLEKVKTTKADIYDWFNDPARETGDSFSEFVKQQLKNK